jgi:hypothetical protein
MRKRSLILLVVLLASWPLASKSQVFSGNIVGYANIAMPIGLGLVCNPFNVDGTNNLNTVMTNSTVPAGTQVYLWNVTNQAFTLPATFSAVSDAWFNPDFVTLATNYLLSPGRGFVVASPSPWLMTFVGIVEQGTLTNFIAGTNKFSLVGNLPPVAGQLGANAAKTIFFPGLDGADAFTFNTNSQSYSDAYTYFQNFGWFDPAHLVDTNGPALAVAQSFFVQNPGPDTNWIQTFIVPNTAQTKALQPVVQKSVPQISHLVISGNQVSLQVFNPGGAPYDVQFSPDDSTWQTAASNLTDAVWSGALSNPQIGYYRVVNH